MGKETESTHVQNTIVSSMDVFFIPTSLRLRLTKNKMHQIQDITLVMNVVGFVLHVRVNQFPKKIQNLNQETVPVEWALLVMVLRFVARTVCVKQAVDPNRCRIDQAF